MLWICVRGWRYSFSLRIGWRWVIRVPSANCRRGSECTLDAASMLLRGGNSHMSGGNSALSLNLYVLWTSEFFGDARDDCHPSTTLPYSSHMAPADSPPQVEIHSERLCWFQAIEDTEENVLQDLCTIPQNTFQNWGGGDIGIWRRKILLSYKLINKSFFKESSISLWTDHIFQFWSNKWTLRSNSYKMVSSFIFLNFPHLYSSAHY